MIALRVTLTYAVVSGLWIFFSDQLLGALVHDPDLMADLSMVKGWFYVLVVSVLLFLQIRASVRELDLAHRKALLFEFTIEKATDLVLWVDPSNRVIYANQSAVRVLGYPAEVLKTMTMGELEVGLDAEELAETWRQLHRDRSVSRQRQLKTAGGLVLPVELRADLIDFQGTSFANVWIVDLTQRLQVEEQLRQAHRLEAVGTLAAGIAHDFNNILTVIQGRVELLGLSLDQPAKAKTMVGQIKAGVQRGSQLVKGLLTFGRGENLHFQRVAFNSLVERAFGFLPDMVGPGVRTDLTLCAGPTDVDADPVAWERVIFNLATNARDAMGGQGSLVLATRLEGDHVVLTVRDTGPGIPAEVRARVFEPFFTTKEAGGTGLGLSIVHGIVTQHRGSIRLDCPPVSGPGTGTEFTIRLPLAVV